MSYRCCSILSSSLWTGSRPSAPQ